MPAAQASSSASSDTRRPSFSLQPLVTERSVLRLERANLQTLGMLTKLVNAVAKNPTDDESK